LLLVEDSVALKECLREGRVSLNSDLRLGNGCGAWLEQLMIEVAQIAKLLNIHFKRQVQLAHEVLAFGLVGFASAPSVLAAEDKEAVGF